MPDHPPATDEVLARYKLGQSWGAPMESEGPPRGRLKIFFGMAPGVGKTYAMLAQARRLAGQGVDVVVGVVETHGRVETEQMLLGLDIWPRRRVEYSGVELQEFDAEGAILRRPDILIVDELAHTNAPGSRRQKRWQDVQACIKAGVNVYTTLNVQHLESLNDVVAQITGVRVAETLPDRVFDEADEVELIDLPSDALHERLRAGKVYLGESASRAVDPSDGFFRKGNLTALRELALRRTATWVDSELRRYKRERGIRTVWPAGERILVAVSASPMSARVVRAAKRMAAGLHAELIAATVETLGSGRISSADRERLLQNLRLGEGLGATTATLAGSNPAHELITFARSRNVGKIVVGKTERPRWRERLLGSFVEDLIRESGDIDIYVVRGDEEGEPEPPAKPRPRAHDDYGGAIRRALRLGGSTIGVMACSTALAMLFYRPPDLSEEALIMLGGVVVAALWLGRGAAALASVIAVLSFNYCFTEPRFTLAVNDSGYLFTFGVMFAVGTLVGTLAARTKEQARQAWSRERVTAAQYALSRELASATDARTVAAIVARHTHDLLTGDVVVCVPTRSASGKGTGLDVLAHAGSPDWFDERERAVAQWAIDHGTQAGAGTRTLPSAAGHYVPLAGTGGNVGLLAVRRVATRGTPVEADESVSPLEGILSQAASALERVALGESEQSAKLGAERERLRSVLLSSVSHDLRTPLASITGAASTLQHADGSPLEPATREALLRTIVLESSRLNDIIGNLVFATRLDAGAIAFRREWTTVEEIVGVGLSRHREALAGRPLRMHLASDLPLIRVDNSVLPQVIHNLVENALRYTPPGTAIAIGAWTSEAQVVVRIADEGPGLAEDEASKVFERFFRGRAAKAPSGDAGHGAGMGLGLTICEGIIRAHAGRIWAEPNTPTGVAFMFSLPIERPQPAMPHEPATSSDQPGSGA